VVRVRGKVTTDEVDDGGAFDERAELRDGGRGYSEGKELVNGRAGNYQFKEEGGGVRRRGHER
jgi:hypothetical protein